MNKQQCPVCGVCIANKETVLFSYGKPGTRARLKARVCQFVKDESKKAQCINTFEGEWTRRDEYD